MKGRFGERSTGPARVVVATPKHTPGPWHWTLDGLRGSDGQLIISHGNIDTRTPDAMQIEAAAELADVLEALVGPAGDLHSQENIARAQAALRRAGRRP